MPFISLPCPAALVRPSRVKGLVRSVLTHPCLVTNIRGQAFIYHLPLSRLVFGFFQMAFDRLRKFPFIPGFLRPVNHEWVLDFVRYFFAFVGMISFAEGPAFHFQTIIRFFC